MVSAMPLPTHAPAKKCNKCGGNSEFRIWLPNPENKNDYEVFECVDCGSFEWLQPSQNKRTASG